MQIGSVCNFSEKFQNFVLKFSIGELIWWKKICGGFEAWSHKIKVQIKCCLIFRVKKEPYPNNWGWTNMSESLQSFKKKAGIIDGPNTLHKVLINEGWKSFPPSLEYFTSICSCFSVSSVAKNTSSFSITVVASDCCFSCFLTVREYY